MPVLTEKEIQYGFIYYHKDEPQPKQVIELSEYQGESVLMINCTQLESDLRPQYKSQKERKRVLQEWCDFLVDNPMAFEELHFVSRLPQGLFDAVCSQKRLRKLFIKWGVYPDISKNANLQSLEYLHLGSGAGTQSIEPIASLTNLVALSVENFQKITDYSPLAKLNKLECLYIDGTKWSPQFIHVDSLDFLKNMKQLRFFHFLTARLASKDMSPVLSLANAEHLTLEASKETKAIYHQLKALPKLKYGSIAQRPELYLS